MAIDSTIVVMPACMSFSFSGTTVNRDVA